VNERMGEQPIVNGGPGKWLKGIPCHSHPCRLVSVTLLGHEGCRTGRMRGVPVGPLKARR